ncbi:MAG TPA: hypothetical protein VGX50_17250, partial [Longimicrobium sp.]|nr:hypothetical protein [Longimicrobium sp.]
MSFLPRPWAELLVRHFCDDPPLDVQASPETPDWEAWLKPVRMRWRQRAEERVAELDSPYFLTNRLAERKPAGATFVGLEFGEPEGAGVPWKAFIIGDTCLFHLRGDRVLRVYPHDDPSRFDNRPAAFLSEGPQHHAPERVDGWAERGDLLVLATDALAKWLLCQPNHQMVADEGAFRTLLDSLDDGAAFESLVNRARREDFRPATPRLEDDDVTFVVVGCGATLPGMQLLAEFGASLLHDAGEPGRPLVPPAA